MAAQRAFYVTQGSLTVRSRDPQGKFATLRFADSDDGLREFDAYLGELSEQPSFMLVDVIEEEFSVDSIPKLGFRDRSALMQRRVERKYPRSRYRLAVYQGKRDNNHDEARVAFCAITNHELVDPWLRVILRHRTPLVGLYSVPLTAGRLMARVYKEQNPTLFVTQHQKTKLRQVFIDSGHAGSARLSESPHIDHDRYAHFLVNEVQRSRRYLERTRLVAHMQQLDVCVIADAGLQQRISALVEENSPTQYFFVDPADAVKRCGVKLELRPAHHEDLYIEFCRRRSPPHNYAISGETRYWIMRRLRHTISGGLFAVAAAASVLAGVYLSSAMFLKYKVSTIESQVSQLSETFRRENENFDYQADSHEMKLAVDTGNYILRNRLPVPWVMQQLGLVLGDYPTVQVQSVSWVAQSAVDPNARPVRRDISMPVAIPAISEVSAEISGELVDFDGDMRKAFAEIDRLVGDLESRTEFSDVVAVEYPLDPSPQAAISGEIVSRGQSGSARFRLRLRFPVQVSNSIEGTGDDAV